VLLSSGDSFPHLIQKRRSQLGFVTYLLNYLHNYMKDAEGEWEHSAVMNIYTYDEGKFIMIFTS
jgi:hypothetical protein